MFLAASSLTVFLALSITGSSVVEIRHSLITLPLTRRLNFSSGTIDFLQHDKARVTAFRDYDTHDRRTDNILVKTSPSFFSYQVQVGIGEPPTTYNLLVDTGSSITWVGASTAYKRTATSVTSGRSIKTTYGDEGMGLVSSFSGPIFYDTITLGGGLTATWFQLGVASTLSGSYDDTDGIFGIGPQDLSRGTIENDWGATIPVFTDHLYLQGKIGRRVVGIFFQPVTREPDSQFGALTFGGTDPTKYFGNIAFTPITAMPPSSHYWGINQRITYGQMMILDFTAGIVDTGTTFLYLASDAFERYRAATGATLDQTAQALRISPNQYRALRNLDFHIGYAIISLTPDAQIWPRSLNTKLPGAVVGAIYLIVADIGWRSGRGLDFVLGFTFIQRFYTVLDGSSSHVGFAPTPFTPATTNMLL